MSVPGNDTISIAMQILRMKLIALAKKIKNSISIIQKKSNLEGDEELETFNE
jgi:hypothetical protein